MAVDILTLVQVSSHSSVGRHEVIEMAKICQVTGKKGNTTAKFIRNRHSQGWKYKAPHKNRTQEANLQSVRLKTPTGTYRLTVAASVIKSPIFNAVACGLKPIPQEWLKKASYNV
ncbi:L28, ribosomal protein L28 [Fimbriimonadaceae bacterium]